MKKIRPLIVAFVLFAGGYFLMHSPPLIEMDSIDKGNGRQVYTDVVSWFELEYPKQFSGNVWHPTARPMVITIVPISWDAMALGCPSIKNSERPLVQVQGQTASGLTYMLSKGSGVGAGQLYSSYCYVIQGAKKSYVLDFEIWSHNGCWSGQCGAYCGTQFEQECKDLDRTEDIEDPINDIVKSFRTLE